MVSKRRFKNGSPDAKQWGVNSWDTKPAGKSSFGKLGKSTHDWTGLKEADGNLRLDYEGHIEQGHAGGTKSVSVLRRRIEIHVKPGGKRCAWTSNVHSTSRITPVRGEVIEQNNDKRPSEGHGELLR